MTYLPKDCQATVMLLRVATAVFVNVRDGSIQDVEQIQEAWGVWLTLRDLGLKVARVRSAELKGVDSRIIEALFEKAHGYAQHPSEPHPEHFLACGCPIAEDLRDVTAMMFSAEASNAA